jgi:protein-S-isoprenylcysteine O-methyltransferase Ste14
MLQDRLTKIGNFIFRYRSYQFLMMMLILFEERVHFKQITDSVFFELFCSFIALCGLLIRSLTIGFVHEMTSGRNTLRQKAEELNTTGAYSIVRNPLYIGNYLILLGISLLAQNHEVVILNTGTFIFIYVPIVLAEEEFLFRKFGEQYSKYTKSVNCIIPSFKNFKRPMRNFSFKMVFKREHDTWLTTMFGLIFVELLREYGIKDRINLEPWWIFPACAVIVVWIVLKYMKRTDKLLMGQPQN